MNEITSTTPAPGPGIDAQSPALMAAVEAALSPYGIDANAPGPQVDAEIDALSPEQTLTV